ncbi:MAG: BatD family protein [Bacteroidales bacterium]|nr:BatD family protein [Bacteroidales bacterium]
MQKSILLLVCFFAWITAVTAQSITVNAPNVVEEGETFRIAYVLNEHNNGQRMTITKVDAFEQIGSPSTGIQNRSVFVNGHMNSSVSYSETYTFKALKKGSFKTPIASITINGKTISSKAQTIEISDFPAFSGSSPKSQGRSQQQTMQQFLQQQMQEMQEFEKQMQKQIQQRSSSASGEDFFTRVTVNKTESFIGEPIYVTLKLYTRYNFEVTEQAMPKFDGFYKKILYEPAVNETLYPTRETFNGREYNVFTFQKLLIYPQKSGDLLITPFELGAMLYTPFSVVRTKGQSPQLTIKVHDFPAGKTANFTGAVGDFQVQAKADVETIAADEAFTFRFTVSGQGNLSLLQKPTITFPQDFEVYDPKVVDHFTSSAVGDKGNKIFEYVIIPRQAGNFEIPSIEFQYFNPQTKSFKTLKTDVVPIEVSKSVGGKSQSVNFSAASKSQLAYQNDDILFIKTGNLQLHNVQEKRPFSSRTYSLIAIILVLGTVVFIVVKRKHIEFNSDESRVKHRKADAETRKRLKQARLCLNAGKETEFYDELAKALWSYVSDKFTIPLADLTIDTVREFLTQNAIDNALIQDLIDVLNQCNFARYAPSGAAANRELLDRSENLILAFQKIGAGK